jgi:hypothetical protein
MTPAEELAQAADKLDALASGATEGPWRKHDTYLNIGGFTATVLSGDGDDVAVRAWVPSFSHVAADGQDAAHADAVYIAAMNPLVGKALAAVLRGEAEMVAALTHAGDMSAGWVNGHVLEIARRINGSES